MSADGRYGQTSVVTTDRKQRAIRQFVGVLVSVLAAVVSAMLAIAGVISVAVPIAAAVLVLACVAIFRRTVAPRSRY